MAGPRDPAYTEYKEIRVEIIPLEARYEELYCSCLEDWSREMREAGAGDLKRRWLERNKARGLRVLLARDEDGAIVGMIQYAPIEYAPIEYAPVEYERERAPVHGADLYYIYCIWVHGHDQGVGNRQGRGIGTRLLVAAETDVRDLGAKGMVAWGLRIPVFMRSRWFKKHGYRRVDTDGIMELLWKRFSVDAVPPRLGRLRRCPDTAPGVVTVTCLRNGWCPSVNLTAERMKRVAREFAERVNYVEIDTDNRRSFEEWGASDQIFIDGTPLRAGPPRTYEQLRKQVARRVRALR